LDASILLAYVLGKSRVQLISMASEALSDSNRVDFQHLINARLQGTPVAYLIGQTEFWSLPIYVNKDVLIPRSDTEILVEQALACMRRLPKRGIVVDVGTGSGAIAVALKHMMPLWTVMGIDQSMFALNVAQINAQKHNLDITFLHGDWLFPLQSRQVDIIVSNPPYLSLAEWDVFGPSLKAEPFSAFVSAPDGLTALQHLIKQGRNHLFSGGWLLVEHGYQQATAVSQLFKQYGYQQITTVTDFSDHERVTYGQFIAQ
jgi:release factor glutamine methyltransferase